MLRGQLPATIGNYRVDEQVGLGAMGIVARARHQVLGREIAIKMRFPENRSDDILLAERFRQGAILQSELNHRHIAQVLDYYETSAYQAIAMEFLSGGSLEAHLKQAGGQLDVSDVLEIGIRLANALAYAHNQGIIHRDIKPGNIMLAQPDDLASIRLTDYGVAKAPDRSPDITVVGANVGTIVYVAGTVEWEHALPASDVYSLGATLYELLTGHIPFDKPETSEVFRRFLDGVPLPPIQGRNVSVPESVAAIVEQTLALDIESRLGSAATVSVLFRIAADLEGLGHISDMHPDDVQPVSEEELDFAIATLPEHLRMDFADASGPYVANRGSPTQSVDLSSIHETREVSSANPLEPRPLGVFDTIEQRRPEWQKHLKAEMDGGEFDDDEADRTIVTSKDGLDGDELD